MSRPFRVTRVSVVLIDHRSPELPDDGVVLLRSAYFFLSMPFFSDYFADPLLNSVCESVYWGAADLALPHNHLS